MDKEKTLLKEQIKKEKARNSELEIAISCDLSFINILKDLWKNGLNFNKNFVASQTCNILALRCTITDQLVLATILLGERMCKMCSP